MTQVARSRRPPPAGRVQDLMDAAAEVFLARGYDATSVQDIADAVGLLKGSLYHYVDSKEDFLFGIIKPVYDAAIETVVPVASSDKEPLERLAEFVQAHVAFVAENLVAFKVRMREFSQLSTVRQAALRVSGDAYYDALHKILTDGRAEGMVDRNLDMSLMTQAIVGKLNAMAQWYASQDKLTPRRVGKQLSGMVVTSVASDEAIIRYGGIRKLRQI